MSPPEVGISGFRGDQPHEADLRLLLVVAAEGRALQTSVVHGVGCGIDAQYLRALENWEFNRSFDFQNKPVSVLFHLGIPTDPIELSRERIQRAPRCQTRTVTVTSNSRLVGLPDMLFLGPLVRLPR